MKNLYKSPIAVECLKLNFVRTLNSSSNFNQNISQINIPPTFAEDFNKYLLKSLWSSTDLKVDFLSLQKWQSSFNEYLLDYPEFKANLENARKSPIIMIKGMNTLELAQQTNFNDVSDFDKINNLLPIKHNAAFSSLIALKLGVNFVKYGELMTLVGNLDKYSHQQNSYYSSKVDLGWHNDGFSCGVGGLESDVLISGIKGHSQALTKIITLEQIKDYFHRNNKADILQKLRSLYVFNSGFETSPRVIDSIISDDQIRFADFGENMIVPNNPSQDKSEIKAIEELKKALAAIDPFSTSLKNGEMLLIDNAKCLHFRSKFLKDDENDISATAPATRIFLRGNLLYRLRNEKASASVTSFS